MVALAVASDADGLACLDDGVGAALDNGFGAAAHLNVLADVDYI